MEDAPTTNPQSGAQDDPVSTAPGESSARGSRGLGWAVAVGALSVALLVAIGVAVFAWYSYTSMLRDFSRFGAATVEVTPVGAGEPWFAVADDGTGSLEGWPYGTSGSGDDDSYYFDVFEVGAVGDVAIQHIANVYVDQTTEFYVGDRRYEGEGSGSTLESIFGMSGEDPEGLMYGDMKLRIDFHREDGRIVADKVIGQPGSDPAPYMY